MKKIYKIGFLAALIIILAVVGAVIYRGKSNSFGYFGKNETNTKLFNTQTAQQNQDEPSKPQGSSVYTYPAYGFTVTLPEGFTVGNFPEGEDGDVTLVQDAQKAYAMQIFVKPFAEDSALTAVRIHKEIPDMKMETPMVVTVGGVSAVAFYSTSDSGQRTREVWFVSNKNLYQISAKAEFDNITGALMESWKWE